MVVATSLSHRFIWSSVLPRWSPWCQRPNMEPSWLCFFQIPFQEPIISVFVTMCFYLWCKIYSLKTKQPLYSVTEMRGIGRNEATFSNLKMEDAHRLWQCSKIKEAWTLWNQHPVGSQWGLIRFCFVFLIWRSLLFTTAAESVSYKDRLHFKC